MSPFPFALSRVFDPADYAQMPLATAIVDRVSLAGQPPHRRWEYALALEAMVRWLVDHGRQRPRPPIYDVGGTESPFADMVLQQVGTQVWVIDPSEAGRRLEDTLEGGTALAEVVTCLSILPAVADLDRFCYYLSCLVAPGGLLVVTASYTMGCAAARRELLLCPKSLAVLRRTFRELQLEPFGGIDHRWHPPAERRLTTLASLVLEKRV